MTLGFAATKKTLHKIDVVGEPRGFGFTAVKVTGQFQGAQDPQQDDRYYATSLVTSISTTPAIQKVRGRFGRQGLFHAIEAR